MTLSLDILDRLIGFDTVSHKSNLALMSYVDGFLKERGFRTTTLPDPEAEKAGLYAEIGPSETGGVLLSAHTDVVPVEGQNWAKPPFKLTSEGNRLYGRGTTDMKGFLAEMLSCADRASQMNLKEPLKLAISYDEEIGCVGISRMMDRLTPLMGRPRAVIVGEPTEMQVVTGHKGKRSFRAEISGQAGHSALAPQFTNALHVATDLVQGLRDMQANLADHGAQDMDYAVPYSTVHVGKLSGGTALNIVPDSADLLFELRHLAEDDPEVLTTAIHSLAAEVSASHGQNAQITLTQIASYPGLTIAPDDPFVADMCALTGTSTGKVAFGTEAGFFADLGLPTIVCGPGSMQGQGHKADEYILTSQLAACRQFLDRLLGQMV